MSDTKTAKKRMEKIELQTVPTNDGEFDALIAALESKSISTATLAQNLGIAQATANLWNSATIGEIYDPTKANKKAIVALFKFADVDTYSMDGWVLPERHASAELPEYAIGEFYKLPVNNGKQSSDCEYAISWTNDEFVLFVPVKNYATDENGFALRNPRCMSKLASKALQPTKI